MNNIILIGLPGSGKTTLGRACAEELGKRFIDMDEAIVKLEQRTVDSIFREFGEAYFRTLESYMALEAAAAQNTLIATGGGVVERAENMEALRQNSLVVFIDRPVELILQDIHFSHRPLLKTGESALRELADRRREMYLQWADLHFQNEESLAAATHSLTLALKEKTAAAK